MLLNKINFNSSNFQQISALEPNLANKFQKLYAVIIVVKSTTDNDSKTLSCIKIHPLELEISSIECRKTCKIDQISYCFNIRFHTFLILNRWYLQFQWMDFDARQRFGNVISCRLYYWNFSTKFMELHCQIWLQSWKLEELKWNFLNNSEVSSYLLGHILLFWKVTMQTIE